MAATADPITRLPDRGTFESRLVQEIGRSSRSGAPLSVLIIDVDRIADVNEALGMEVGDELLLQIAGVIATSIRNSDTLYRYGGDEFSVLLPDSELGTAFLAAERCRQEVEHIEVDGRPASISIGIAEYVQGKTSEELIAKCEIALFRAKESGGGRSWRADDPRRHGLNPIALSEELTEREWDILINLSHRRTEQEIARRLGISRGTVRSHKARIRRKLHVSPDVRLSEFVRINFRDLIDRLPTTGS
jgi:diguanylate cyclase (GGDEF)-like protein